MPADERHIRDLERAETVAEASMAKEGESGPINVRIRSGSASFDVCEFDYAIRAVRAQSSGDIVLNVDPLEEANIGI